MDGKVKVKASIRSVGDGKRDLTINVILNSKIFENDSNLEQKKNDSSGGKRFFYRIFEFLLLVDYFY